MSFLPEEDPLWAELEDIARDEGVSLYDAERLTRAHVRIALIKNPGDVAKVGAADTAKDEGNEPEVEAIDDEGEEDEEETIELDEADLEAASQDEEIEEHSVPAERVSSGDCTRVCRRLMAFFRAEGDKFGMSTEPEIEVSSSGLSRNLRLPRHFVGAIGERVRVTYETAGAEGGRRTTVVVGKILSADSEAVTVVGEAAQVKNDSKKGKKKGSGKKGADLSKSARAKITGEIEAGKSVVISLDDVKRANVEFQF